jgi:transcriptional regulator with PAS, ATPase and Fis domain
VLITGETGAGKERVAKLIHARSPRRFRPFVVVECATLQESLLESELFGHERGAFTGADRGKPGLFEVANGGTIFLHEIGEISPATQTKLLRVLDSSTFRHVGGTNEIRVDVRVLTASNRDVSAMVRQGLFREDLFYRLGTISVEVPPLRARGADVVELLAQHFVTTLNERFGSAKHISEEALQLLRRHDWPRNVREPLHVVEAAMVLCEGTCILPEHLPATFRNLRVGSAANVSSNSASLPTLVQAEREHIRLALETSKGHRGNAAKILGISERNLYRKFHEHGLLALNRPRPCSPSYPVEGTPKVMKSSTVPATILELSRFPPSRAHTILECESEPVSQPSRSLTTIHIGLEYAASSETRYGMS